MTNNKTDGEKLNDFIVELLTKCGMGNTEQIWSAIQAGKTVDQYHKEHTGKKA